MDDLLINATARVAATALVGAESRCLQEGSWEQVDRPTTIGPRSEVGHFCVVERETLLAADVILEAYVHIGRAATVGDRVLLVHRASVGARAVIGADSVIGGRVGERSVVGSRCRVFGSLIHRQLDPTLRWDALESAEGSAVLHDGVFVGWGASVIGAVTVGRGGYICAGATVTRDVPAGCIVSGVNEQHRPADWDGSLGKSDFFRADGMAAGPAQG